MKTNRWPTGGTRPLRLERLTTPAGLSALILGASLLATSAARAQVTVADAWIRSTVAGQQATGAFMQMVSARDTVLVSAASPAARIVEIHEMKVDGGVMRMHAIDQLALPAGKAVELKPGGYHLMLQNLVAPLKVGESIPVTLTFQDTDGKKTLQEIKVPVRALTTGPAK
jgi:copper(I)-binding protein